MKWLLCAIGLHRWARAPDFCDHPRRECGCCGESQVRFCEMWITEDAKMRWAVREGQRLMRVLTGSRSE
jgi:hypothetical protein